MRPATSNWDPALEDVHLNLEAALRRGSGRSPASSTPAGRATTRSPRTCGSGCAGPIDRLDAAIVGLERALVGLAERDGDAVMPGSTHIQPAQPVLLAHHLLAYVEMLERDRGRLADVRRRANVSPLGAGALAGAGYLLDRGRPPASSASTGVTANSLDAVSDRDFVVEFWPRPRWRWST